MRAQGIQGGVQPNKGTRSFKITGMVMMLVCCASLSPGLSDVPDFVDLSNMLQSSKVSKSWSFHIGSRLNTLGNVTCVYLTPALLFLLYISADELSLADVVLNALALNFLLEVDNLLVFKAMEEEATRRCLAALEAELNSIKGRRASVKGCLSCLSDCSVRCVCNIIEALCVSSVATGVTKLYMTAAIIATPICL